MSPKNFLEALSGVLTTHLVTVDEDAALLIGGDEVTLLTHLVEQPDGSLRIHLDDGSRFTITITEEDHDDNMAHATQM